MTGSQALSPKVLPEFAERHAEHQQWRRRRLGGVDLPVNSSV
jgi:hypothetical protein